MSEPLRLEEVADRRDWPHPTSVTFVMAEAEGLEGMETTLLEYDLGSDDGEYRAGV